MVWRVTTQTHVYGWRCYEFSNWSSVRNFFRHAIKIEELDLDGDWKVVPLSSISPRDELKV
jgi:hypothetical protein